VRVIDTPIRAPNANAFGERWVATVRAECLDWVLVLGRRHLKRCSARHLCPALPRHLCPALQREKATSGFYGPDSPQEHQYDEFVDKGLLAPTDAERKQTYASAQEILSSFVMNNFPLIFAAKMGAWRKGVTGYRPGPGDIPDLTTTRIT
jgi:hypothetical protein